MAILDLLNEFSDAQAITTTAVSTNVINLGSDRNIGMGEPMCVLFNVDVAADGTTTDETYQFDVQTGSTVTPTTVISSIIIGYATLVAGYQFALALPPDLSAGQYLRLNYVVGGTTPTITVTAHLMPISMIPKNVFYAKNYPIQ